jgi:hypothetical protein
MWVLAFLCQVAATAAAAPGGYHDAAPWPVATEEMAHYRVSYGLLGDLGGITVTLTPGAGPDRALGVRATGKGRGSMLGIGEIEKRVETEVDARARTTSRWVNSKTEGNRVTVDTIHQPAEGNISLVRRRAGESDRAESFQRQRTVHDPVGFLLRMRLSPPTGRETVEVLDGRALWLMIVEAPKSETIETPALPGPGGSTRRRVLRIDGKADPVFWDGSHDSDRPERSFSLWLTDDLHRTPVRLIMPLAIGEVSVDLVSLVRPPTVPPTFLRGLHLVRITRWLEKSHPELPSGN